MTADQKAGMAEFREFCANDLVSGAQRLKHDVFAPTCGRRTSAIHFQWLFHSTYIPSSIGVGE